MVTWVKAAGGGIPEGAWAVGQDSGGGPWFAARAAVPGGGLQLGRIGPGLTGALIPYDGLERLVVQYEVLCGATGFPTAYAPFDPFGPAAIPDWGARFPAVERPTSQARLGHVPPGLPHRLNHPHSLRVGGAPRLEFHAIVCGHEATGHPMFCALVRHAGGLHPGKVGRRMAGANIGVEGLEVGSLNPYSVLSDASHGFLDPTGEEAVAEATPLGVDVDGSPLFLARCPTGLPGLQIGKMRADWRDEGARVGYGGAEVIVADYQLLFAHEGRTRWARASGGAAPDGAVALGCEADGAPLFAARTLPGRDAGADGVDLGVQIGKVRPGFGGAKFPFGGREITVPDYEVLVSA
jgi:hypothetical protein